MWYYAVILCCDTVILCGDIVLWYCAVILCNDTMLCYCAVLLCCDIVLCYYATVLCYCAVLLCCATVLWYCDIVILRCDTVILCCDIVIVLNIKTPLATRNKPEAINWKHSKNCFNRILAYNLVGNKIMRGGKGAAHVFLRIPIYFFVESVFF